MPKPTLGQGLTYDLPPIEVQRDSPELYDYLLMIHTRMFGLAGGVGDMDDDNVANLKHASTTATTAFDHHGSGTHSGLLQSAASTDAVASAVAVAAANATTVTSANGTAIVAANAGTVVAADAGGTYTAAEQTLINEIKADYNGAVTLINELKTQVDVLVTLANEMKGDVNIGVTLQNELKTDLGQVVTDLNAVVTNLNGWKASSRTATLLAV